MAHCSRQIFVTSQDRLECKERVSIWNKALDTEVERRTLGHLFLISFSHTEEGYKPKEIISSFLGAGQDHTGGGQLTPGVFTVGQDW